MIPEALILQAISIPGWLTKKEGELLFNLAKKCKGNENAIVEIGSFQGRSTIFITAGSKYGNGLKVYACDPHVGDLACGNLKTFEDFKKNIKYGGLDKLIIPLVMTSEEAVKDFDKKIEMIFFDGNHDYEYVKKDFLLWEPKMVENSWIAFHDTNSNIGPDKVVREFIFHSNNFRKIRFCDSIVYAQKCKFIKTKEKLQNFFVYLCWETFQVLRKVRKFMRRII